MKTLIHFKPPKPYDLFTGARMRKTLKGACELSGVTWVDSLLGFPHIFHCLSPEDDGKLKQAQQDGCIGIVSCGYCEDDPQCRFFEKKEDGLVLRGKALHMLNQADLVLVPSKTIKEEIDNAGVVTSIDVLTPGVSLARFDALSTAERSLFYRYFGIREDEPFIISLGDYDDQESIKKFVWLGTAAPRARFVVIGNRPAHGAYEARMKRITKKMPRNVRFTGLVEDDVFRSGMVGASCFLQLANGHDNSIQILEAFASKTLVAYFGDPYYDRELVRENTAFLLKDAKNISDIFAPSYLEEANRTIMQGYALARENSLPKLGERLKDIYQRMVGESEE